MPTPATTSMDKLSAIFHNDFNAAQADVVTKIYTKTGDSGETGLWGGRRVPKSHPRVRAYGDVDELNSALGVVLASFPESKSFDAPRKTLGNIQEELFVVGALLATPPESLSSLTGRLSQGLPADAATRLEGEMDRMTEDLDPLQTFILPGGSMPGALLHAARAVCRRAEREVVALAADEKMPEGLIVYLNRLSDYLFTAARWANHQLKQKETPWQGLASVRSKKS